MAYNLLLVDDEATLLKALSETFSSDGYNVFIASTAEEALGFVQTKNIDVVISDIKMPGMDGIEFLKRAKGIKEEIEIILYTAYGSFETATQALRYRAFDYITKPFQIEEVKSLVKEAVKSVRGKRNKGASERIAYDSDLYNEEAKNWINTQNSSVNDISPIETGLSIRAEYLSESSFNNKFVDVFQISEKKCAIVMAHLTGQNDKNSIFAPLIRMLARQNVKEYGIPSRALMEINRIIYDDTLLKEQFALFAGVYDREKMTLQYANAGCETPFWIKFKKREITHMMCTGLPLGMVRDIKYKDKKVKLNTGDLILFHDESLIKLFNRDLHENSDLKDEKVLNEIFNDESLNTPIVQIFNLIRLEWEKTEKSLKPLVMVLEACGKMQKRILQKICVPSRVESAASVQELTRDVVRKVEKDKEKQHAIISSVNEAVENAILYAYTDREDEGIELVYKVEKGNLKIDIIDYGTGFEMMDMIEEDFNTYERSLITSGRGIYIMKHLMDKTIIKTSPGNGTEICMFKKLSDIKG